MASEAEFERTPDAVAGRRLLDERLTRLAPAEFDAFWEAVRRCYASAPPEGEGGAPTAPPDA